MDPVSVATVAAPFAWLLAPLLEAGRSKGVGDNLFAAAMWTATGFLCRGGAKALGNRWPQTNGDIVKGIRAAQLAALEDTLAAIAADKNQPPNVRDMAKSALDSGIRPLKSGVNKDIDRGLVAVPEAFVARLAEIVASGDKFACHEECRSALEEATLDLLAAAFETPIAKASLPPGLVAAFRDGPCAWFPNYAHRLGVALKQDGAGGAFGKILMMQWLAELHGNIAAVDKGFADTLGRLEDIQKSLAPLADEMAGVARGVAQLVAAQSPWLDLKAPDVEQAKRSGNRLTYWQEATALFGREREIAALAAFRNDAMRKVLWTAVTGPGGVGKSRLVHEAMKAAARAGWDAGFFDPDSQAGRLWNPASWRPDRPAFIAIDYAAGQIDKVAGIVETLIAREADLPHKVRFVLIARESRAGAAATDGEHWLTRFRGARTGSGRRHGAEWESLVLDLAPLVGNALVRMVETYAGGRNFDRDAVARFLERPDIGGRPLFAGLVGEAVAAGSFRPDAGMADLLVDTLQRWRQRYWDPEGVTERDLDLLALVTICGPVDKKRALDALAFSDAERRGISVRYAAMVGGGADESEFRRLEPDLLGECFVLHRVGTMLRKAERDGRAPDTVPNFGAMATTIDVARTDQSLVEWAGTDFRPKKFMAGTPALLWRGWQALAEGYAAAGPATNIIWLYIELCYRFLQHAGDTDSARLVAEEAHRLAESPPWSAPSTVDAESALGASHSALGAVLLEEGDRPGALAEYRKGLAIARHLTELKPDNTKWQRDLSVSHERVGDVLRREGDRPGALAEYRKGLAIRRRLTELNPDNTEWQRDLSISHETIGDVLREEGDRPGALAEYRKGLAIARRLTELNPDNTEWQRGLSSSHERIGDVLREDGDRPGALAEYRKGLEICRRLTALNPDNTEWQCDRAFAELRIWEVADDAAQKQQHLDGARESIDRARAIAPENRLVQELTSVLEKITKRRA